MRSAIVQQSFSSSRVGVALAAAALCTALVACSGSSPAGDGAPPGDGGAGERGDGAQGDPARRCKAGEPGGGTDDLVDPSVRQRVSGDNGDFVDACDGAGNLAEQHCEVTMSCTPGPRPSCEGLQTGKVVVKLFDCGGRCVDGTCDARCPAVDDGLDLRAADGAGGVTLQNRKDRRFYACTLSKDDDPADAFDCRSGPVAGQTALVTTARLLGAFCTGGAFGSLSLILGLPDGSGTAACSYSCALQPGG